jgi:septum formation protein
MCWTCSVDRARLILASGSPRRRELLAAVAPSFDIQVTDVDETRRPGENPADMVIRLSRDKATALTATADVKDGADSAMVAILSADTVVALDGAILGKPSKPADAAAMLRALRARTHQVYTAVSLLHRGHLATRLSISDVKMRDYADGEIEAYVASGDPTDKAGAYAIQHEWFAPVAEWSGCYTGIMGLPLYAVAELLAQAGISDPIDVAVRCELATGQCCCRSHP